MTWRYVSHLSSAHLLHIVVIGTISEFCNVLIQMYLWLVTTFHTHPEHTPSHTATPAAAQVGGLSRCPTATRPTRPSSGSGARRVRAARAPSMKPRAVHHIGYLVRR